SDEVRRNRQLFDAVGVEPGRLRFKQLSLYDLPELTERFDQIICSETLEHIARDELVLQYFHDILRPHGVLHLCSPNAVHPVNNLGRTNQPEDGGHVRDGYTLETYTAKLGKAGFRVETCAGLGSPLLVALDARLRWVRNIAGDVAALPLFLIMLPLSWFDKMNPRMPVSLYLRAIRCDNGTLPSPFMVDGTPSTWRASWRHSATASLC